MREWVEDMIYSVARADLGKTDPNEADDFEDYGFKNDFQMAVYTWLHHKAHGTLPDSGGLLDQSWSLVFDDWGVLNRRYNAAVADIQDDEAVGDLLDHVDEQAGDVESLL